MTSSHSARDAAGRIGLRELVALLDGWRQDAESRPGYVVLAARLRTLVLDGRLPLHVVLPSERALALALGVSRTLTTAAYRALRDEGFAEGRHGSGTWTCLPADDTDHAVWPALARPDAAADFSTAAPGAPPELHAALVAALAELPRLLPGHGYVSAGLPELRAAVAHRYTVRGLATDPEEVVVTQGATQGLGLVLGALVRPGARVLVEDPTWPPIVDAIRALGGRAVPMPVEAGWDAAWVRTHAQRVGATVAVLMPDAQNPTGRLLDGPERGALAAALADAGCVAVVDETLADLDLRAEFGAPDAITPPPFAVAGRRGSVVHVGSASKTFWAGLRVGWVRAERSLVGSLAGARLAQDFGGAPLEQLATAHLLTQVDGIVARRRAQAALAARVLSQALATHLPQWSVPLPEAGLSVWCRLPAPLSAAVAGHARTLGLPLPTGARFGVDGGHASRLRLAFSGPVGAYEPAVRRLAQAWAAAVSGGSLAADAIDGRVV